MADSYSISNSWMCYIKNSPYVYPGDDNELIPAASGSGAGSLNTGWQIIPNMLWKHFCTPKQWADLCINYEAYHVESINVSLFNMIPMTQQLAIQGNSIFTAFNNCIYAVAYQDKLYETSWENWYDPRIDAELNLLYKEGQACERNTNTKKQKVLPTYLWTVPNPRALFNTTYANWYTLYSGEVAGSQDSRLMSQVYPAKDESFSQRPSGVVWDPFNRPEEIMELRPGKNAINMSWECADVDSGKWFNLDQIAWWWPYTAAGPYDIHQQRPGELRLSNECDPDRLSSKWQSNPPTNDYTIPNWSDIPVVPMQWWWKEIQSSIAPDVDTQFYSRVNEFFAGTEAECYKYGPHQMFVKMIPLFDGNGTHIACNANISVKMTLNLKVKKRRSALYAPTWGPWSWYDLYTAQSKHQRFAPPLVRYRTGGMRRTWQNRGDTANNQTQHRIHPRESPYIPGTTVPAGSGEGQTRTTVTYTKDSGKTPETVTIQFHKQPRATSRPQPSAPPMEIEEDTGEMRDPSSVYPALDAFKKPFK